MRHTIENDIIGKTITDIAFGYSFIELKTNDGTYIIESTDKKSTKHQLLVDVKMYEEKNGND